jgi:RNA polymerase sigma factor (sigma-70 family)
MAFPETRLSLIRRVVATGDAASWDLFVANYWRPTCRFAMRIGNLQWSDAEDVASKVFETLYRKSLLESWLSQPNARFKTLLCTVVRNIVLNAVRSQRTAARHQAEQFQRAEDLGSPATNDQLNLFYDIWAEELLKAAVNSLMTDYHREGKGDYFRVLHARICEEMPVKEIAAQLDLKPTDVDNYYRHARDRLAERIRQSVRKDAASYTELTDLDDEFRHEWQLLAQLVKHQGGLEAAVRKALQQNQLQN